jgi:hypothetical protein
MRNHEAVLEKLHESNNAEFISIIKLQIIISDNNGIWYLQIYRIKNLVIRTIRQCRIWLNNWLTHSLTK